RPGRRCRLSLDDVADLMSDSLVLAMRPVWLTGWLIDPNSYNSHPHFADNAPPEYAQLQKCCGAWLCDGARVATSAELITFLSECGSDRVSAIGNTVFMDFGRGAGESCQSVSSSLRTRRHDRGRAAIFLWHVTRILRAHVLECPQVVVSRCRLQKVGG
ncbi:hypothetical protein BaRGS_00039077, partial [Batillaria attramentaria]